MIGEKRARELCNKATYKRQSLAGMPSTAPINQRIQLRAYCIIWELTQRYRAEGSVYYVSKSSYEADLAKITALADKIIQGGDYEAEALEAVNEVREYLELVAGYRVRDNRKTRVY